MSSIIRNAETAIRQAARFFGSARYAADSIAGAARDYYRGARAVHDSRSGGGNRYAAASTTRLGQSWVPVTKDINTIVTSQAAVIRARVQQLVRDFPFFARACNVMVNYTVGTGIKYQPKVKGSDGKLDKTLNQQLEDAWCYWVDQVDAQNKQNLYAMMGLAKRQDVEAGEFINVLVQDRTPGLYLPVTIRSYEPDWLTSNGAKGEGGAPLWDASTGSGTPSSGRAILGGVEYDMATGRILAYHLGDPRSIKPPVRVPARWVMHGHEVIRPGQMRGISPFVTAVLMAHDLNEMLNAELDAAQMAAKWLGFVKSPQGGALQSLRVTGASMNADGTTNKIEEVQNAILEYLRPGEEITFASSNRPGANFEPFVRFIIRMVAIVTHTSYELLSGDYSGLSYSNLKAIRVDMLEDYDPIIARHVFQFCRPAHQWFMDYLYLSGRVSLPGYEVDPARYMRAYWQPSGHRSIDPQREGRANIEAMKALVRSPQEIAQERGRDLDDIVDEIKEAAETIQAATGLDIYEVWGALKTPLANNPAAGDDESGGGKKTGGKLKCKRT